MELQAKTNCGRVSADGSETHYVTLTFVAPQAGAAAERRPVNLGLALDRSGSMGGEKIELARKGVETSLNMLRANDRFAIVTFDHEIGLLATVRAVTAEARAHALGDLAGVSARGNTNLSGGWLRAAGEVQPHAGDGAITRVILLTDGQANEGITDAAELWGHAARLREAGVLTSTIGIGQSFNEALLRGLADQGGGNAYYVENARQLPDVLSGEVGEALEVVLRGTQVDVSVPEGAGVTLLEAFASMATGGGLRVRLGDLTSNQLVQMTFEVSLPAASAGRTIGLGFALHAAGAEGPVGTTRVTWEYDTPEAAAAAPRDAEVELRAATVMEARARHEALELNAAGDRGGARRAVLRVTRKLRNLGAHSVLFQAGAERLAQDTELLASVMDAAEMKRRHFAATHEARGRDASGRARKRPQS